MSGQVLIADDHPLIRQGLRSLLENNAPASYIIIAVVGGVSTLSLLVVVGRKYLAVQIRIKSKSTRDKES